MQEMIKKLRGLYTHPSDFESTPEGGLSVADDIVIDQEDVASPRRGFDRLTSAFATGTDRAHKLFFYQDKILAHYATSKLGYYDAGWTNVSEALSAPTGTTVRSERANQNLYLTSSAGIKKLDAYNSSVVDAGVPKALGITATINNPAATSGWMGTTDVVVAYRAVWGLRDLNNNLIIGAVSQREVVENTTGATVDIGIRVEIPDGITTAHFVQVYRSAAVATGVEPNDDLGLVYEVNPTQTNIDTDGYLSFTDITPDALRGATIYTAANQEGLASNNEQPPLALDLGVYKGSMFYANTTSRHRTFITLLASGGVNGLAVNDTIEVDGVTYTAKLTETAASAQFKVHGGSFTFVDADVSAADDTITETAHGLQNGDIVKLTTTGTLPTPLTAATTYYVVSAAANTFKLSATSGGSAINITGAAGGGTHTVTEGAGSASQNIADTALSLVRVINRYADSTVYGYYMSDIDDLPGQLLFEERALGGGGFATNVNNTTCWSPVANTTFTFTAATTDIITANAHGLVDGTPFTVNSSTTLPAGLSAATTYYVIDATTNTFKASATLGGTAVDITNTGTGTHTAYIGEASSNDRFPNGISFSKTNEPEAVPLTNTFRVGSAAEAIQRIVPLRDSLFIFKEDGIYRVSGEDPGSFRVDLFDSTTRLLAPESVAVLNNQIFALTDQGVVAITEAGVQVKSRPIEITLTSLLGVNASVFKEDSFGVAYETDRKYILFTPTASSDTTPSQAFVYNTFTNTWTRWVLNKVCGGVNPADDKLYLGDAASAYINQERKAYNFRDHADFKSTIVLSAVSDTTLTLSSGIDDVVVGDVIYESDTVFARVTEVDAAAGTATVHYAAGFATGNQSLYGAIPSKVAWIPFTSKNPGSLKHYREVTLFFKEDFTGDGTLAFTSDVSQSEETETLTGTDNGGWGQFGWGEALWGGTPTRRPIRVLVPRNKQRCTLLTIEFQHSTAFTKYLLLGLSLIGNVSSERVAY